MPDYGMPRADRAPPAGRYGLTSLPPVPLPPPPADDGIWSPHNAPVPVGPSPDALPLIGPDSAMSPLEVFANWNVGVSADVPVQPVNLSLDSPVVDNGGGSVGDPVRLMPPWLVSLFVHMAGMIILGLLTLPQVVKSSIEMAASFADTLGEQLDADVSLSAVDVTELQQPVIAKTELPRVEEPLLRPESIVVPDGHAAHSEFESPAVGMALTGREPGMKDALLAAYGGNAITESAVAMALEWLRRNQRADGTWSLTGPYANGGRAENVTAATAMALLAFQGAGHTHQQGRYKDTVNKAWKAMLRMQKTDGDFWKGSVRSHRLYSQAQATIAVCEIYGMTKDSRFRAPAQRAVDYAVKIQDDLGGWRYEPGTGSDTSVTGWFVMALQSARMAELEVPAETWRRVSGFLDQVGQVNGAIYTYQPGPGGQPSYSMTAEALLCRQYLGWAKTDERLQNGISYLTALPIDWNDKNVYYWYYATQVLHHMGDDTWNRWNETLREVLPAQQTTSGAEKGSWSPFGDEWGMEGGRLYTTCLCAYMLEVYYRHLPIYASIYE